MRKRVFGLTLLAIGIGMLLVFLLPGTGFVITASIICIFLGYLLMNNY
ncbi:MAG: hypothetical protein GX308_02480 [Epulopiscium sp.]|nr:hypothetical protein [Candidatus Epulonipiscium sp.]